MTSQTSDAPTPASREEYQEVVALMRVMGDPLHPFSRWLGTVLNYYRTDTRPSLYWSRVLGTMVLGNLQVLPVSRSAFLYSHTTPSPSASRIY